MFYSRTLVAVFVSLWFAACSAPPEERFVDSPPTAAEALIPEGPYYRDSVISVNPVAVKDLDDGQAALSVKYAWFVNGEEVPGQNAPALSGVFQKGDTVFVRVTPNDGMVDGEPVDSNEVTIANQKPQLTGAAVGPGVFTRESVLTVTPGTPADIDGDEVTFKYQWFKNGASIAGATTAVLSGKFAKGDKVLCRVTPSDGVEDGEPVDSDQVVITNLPPKLGSAFLASGTYRRDATLTAAALGAQDPDGDAVILKYRWFVNGTFVGGATAATLAGAFAKNDAVAVEITPFDGAANGAPLVSNTIIIANTAPSISGASIAPSLYTETSSVSVAAGATADADGDGVSLRYTWYVNGLLITGQTGTSLTGSSFKKGDVITAAVTPHDGTADGAPAYANAVTIQNTAPVLGSASIPAGTYTRTSTLTANPGAATDADGDAVTFQYQWLRNGTPMAGETAQSLTGGFVKGDAVRAQVTPFDGSAAGSAVLTNTITIANTPPVLASVALNAGPHYTGSALSATPGATSDADGDTVTVSYQWYRNGAPVAGQTTAAYSGAQAKNDQIYVSATPNDGTVNGTPVSSPVTTIQNSAPAASTASLGAGPYYVTSTLTLTAGAGTDPDGDTVTLKRQWFVNGNLVSGQTGASLAAPYFKKGDTVFARVTPNDGTLDGAPLDSNTVTIQNSLPVAAAPSIGSGPYNVNSTITATPGATSDADGDPVTLAYQWLSAGTPIAGETGTSLAGAFAKTNVISVRVIPNDGTASGAAVTSTTVTIQNSLPTLASITIPLGTYLTGAALPTNLGATADADGDTVSVTYQWFRGGSAVSGQSAATYSGPSAKGDQLYVQATPSDGSAGAVVQSNTITIANSAPTMASANIGAGPYYVTSTITVAATPGADPDGDTVTLKRQWFVNGSLVSGQTGVSLAAPYFKKGDTVFARVTPNDGTVDGAPLDSSAVTIQNSLPVAAAPSIGSGPYYKTSTITATPAATSDADGDAVTLSYQWLKAGSPIVGQTGNALAGAFVKADVIAVRVTPNDGTANGAAVTSSTITVQNSLPTLASITIPAGTYLTGAALPTNLGATADADGDTVTVTYQWFRNGVAVAQTAATYAGISGRGEQYYVQATPSDGAAGAMVQSNTVTIANSAPSMASANIGAGPYYKTSTITVAATANADADGDTVTLKRQWLVNGIAVSGQTGATLAAPYFKKGDTVVARVTPNDGLVDGTPLDSNTVTIQNSLPVAVAPSIGSGPYYMTSTIPATPGAASDADGDPVTVSYQWLKAGAPIAGQTGAALAGAFVKTDVISLRVTPNDGTANGAAVTSTTVTIQNSLPTLAGVTIPAGTYLSGTPLPTNLGATADADGDTVSVTYQWFRGGVAVSGQTAATYTGPSAKGDQLYVLAAPSDGAAGAAVQSNAITISNSLPTIASATLNAGPHYVTSTIGFSAGATSDADGDTITLKRQWYVNGMPISGQTGLTLAAPYFKQGDSVRVRVTPNDGTADGVFVLSNAATIAGSAPAVGSVSLGAGPFSEASVLTPDVVVTDDDNDSVSLSYVWERNGVPIPGATLATLTSADFTRGDQIAVAVRPYDGALYGAWVTSTAVLIGNTAPDMIGVSIGSGPYDNRSTITASPLATDRDGDLFTYQYTWQVNGAIVAGQTGPSLTNAYFDRGDQVSVSVTADDGTALSAPMQSNLITIQNAPPVVSSVAVSPAVATKGTLSLSATVSASDADGDGLTYEYEWVVNGTAVAGETTASLANSFFARNDSVTVHVRAGDGTTFGGWRAAPAIVIGNAAPALASASLNAGPHDETSTLTVTPAGWTDADGDLPGYGYQWYVNGFPVVGQTAASLEGTYFSKGDAVFCQVIPDDGFAQGDPVNSNTAIIQNRAPSMGSVTFGGGPFRTNDILTANVLGWSDADGDAPAYLYTWYVNGLPVAGQTGPSLSGAYFDRGNTVSAAVTPWDGTDTGLTVYANAVTIENTPPAVLSASIGSGPYYEASLIQAFATGSDADGDTYVYAFQWYVNGLAAAGATAPTLSGAVFNANDTVFVRISAHDGTAGSPEVNSNLVLIQTLLAPTGLTAVAGDGQVSLSWNAVTSATGYAVFRSTTSGSSFTQLASPVGTSFADNTVTNGITYYYVVRAVSAGAQSNDSAEQAASPAAALPPAPPTGLVAVPAAGRVDLSWDYAVAATMYRVFSATALGGPYAQAGTTSVNAFGHTGLSNGTVYYYYVKAVNANGDSAGTSIVSARPQVAPPSAPAGLTASSGNAQVFLAWSPSPGATSYKVFSSTIAGGPYAFIAGTASTAFTDATVANGTTYFYVVRAVNAGGESGNSSEASATPQLPAPAAPTGLTASPGNAKVDLAWNASASASSYRVLRSTTSGGGYVQIAAPAVTSYTDASVANGVVYYYVVRAVNSGGTSGLSAQVSATPQAPAPPTPTGLAASPGNGQVALSWNASAGAAYYRILRSTTPGAGYAQVATSAANARIDATVTNGTTYYYVVAAVNSAGLASGNSLEAAATPQVPAPPTPTGLTASAGDAKIDLQWSAVTGATSYKVFRGTASGSHAFVTSVLTNTYTDTAVANGTAYYYVVKAANTGGESGFSSEASATPQVPAPAAPANLIATAGDGLVSLAWDPVSGASGYQILKSTTSGSGYATVATSATAAFADYAVANGTTYYYVVRAYNAGGNSGNSNEMSAMPQMPPPSTPANLTSSAGNGTVSLTWDVSTNAQFYIVRRSTTSGAGYATVATTAATAFTDTTVSNGTTYYYIVRARNSAGVHSGYSNETSATPGVPAPQPPTGLSTSSDVNAITVTWNASSGATSYRVYSSLSAGGPYSFRSQPMVQQFIDASYAQGVRVYYVVTAVNAGGESGYSAETSGMRTTSTPPSAPGGVYTIAQNNRVDIGWNTVSGATGYTVHVATSYSGPYSQLGTSSTNAFIDWGALNGNTYYYYVKSYNGFGSSGPSTIVQASPGLAPAAPTSPTAMGFNGSVMVGWYPAQGATAYTVYRSEDPMNVPWYPVANTWQTNVYDSAVSNGTTYYYKVRAHNEFGSSGDSLTTWATPQAPPPPPSWVWANPGDGQVDLFWEDVAGVGSYQIWRSTNPGSGYTFQQQVGGTGYTDYMVSNGTTYYYVIRSVTMSGESGDSEMVSATPFAPVPPNAPSAVTAVAGNGQVTVSWSAPFSATGYTVYRSVTSGSGFMPLTSTGRTSFGDVSVSNGVTYYYQISAHNNYGEGMASPQTYATPQNSLPPAPPAALSAVGRDAAVDLSWQPSNGASQYIVRRNDGVEFTVGGTSFTDTPVSNWVTYTYRVAAKTATQESAPSQPVSVTPRPAPEIPQNASAMGGPQTIYIGWDPVTTATSYEVQAAAFPGGPYALLVTTTTTWASESMLGDGETRYYKVRALSSSGASGFTTPFFGTTLPPPPVLVSAEGFDARVDLAWNAAAGAAFYAVFSATMPGGPYMYVDSVTGTTFSDYSVANGYTYYYVVRAGTNPMAPMSDDSNELAALPFDPSGIPPAPPAGVFAAGADSRVNLSWLPVTAAISYQVFRSEISGGPYSLAGAVTTASFTDFGRANGTPVYYVVRAANMFGAGGLSAEASAVPAGVSRNVCLTNAIVNTVETYDAAVSGPASFVSRLGGGSLTFATGITYHAGRNELFVASLMENQVSVFPLDYPGGNTAPIRILKGGATGLGGPVGIAVDPVNGELIVANLIDGTVTVYPVGASGDSAPDRTLNVPGAFSVAVAPSYGELFVSAQTTATPAIRIFNRTATGDSPPVRIIAGPATQLADQENAVLTYDAAGDRIVITDSAAGAIFAFNRAASGDVAPVWFVQGANTTLQVPFGVTYSPADNRVYVVDQDGDGAIKVFDGAISGNVTPVRTISGAATGLSGSLMIAYEPAAAQLFVTSVMGASIRVFDAGVSGDTAPARIFTDGNTGLARPVAVAADLQGGLLFALNTASETITAYPLTAVGGVPPLRTIGGAVTLLASPIDIGYSTPNDELVVLNGDQSITVYSDGATGNAAPLRRISGAATQLSSPRALVVTPDSGEIIVVQDGPGMDVLVFEGNAGGNAAPTRTIQSMAIGQAAGVAYDRIRQEIVVISRDGTVAFFSRFDSGNVMPQRLFRANLNNTLNRYGLLVDTINDKVLVVGERGEIYVYEREATGDALPVRTLGAQRFWQEPSGIAFCEPPPAPAAPANVVATAANGRVSLTWSVPEGGAYDYAIYRKVGSDPSYTNYAYPDAPAFVDENVVNGTTYSYLIFARNTEYVYGPASVPVAATPMAPPPPPAPTGLVAEGGYGQVRLTWDPVAGADGYTIHRRFGGCCGFFQIGEATGESFIDPWVMNGDTYAYIVKAVNENGAGPDSNEAWGTPSAAALPGAPALTAAAGAGSVALMWEPALGATSYRILRSTTQGAGYSEVATAQSWQRWYADSSVSNGVTYYYVVIGVNPNGQGNNSNEEAATPNATLPPAPPIGLMAHGRTDFVEVSFMGSAGATYYRLLRSNSPGSGYAEIATSPGGNYNDFAVANGGSYYYAVVAVNANGDSAPSNVDGARPLAVPGNFDTTGFVDQIWLSWDPVPGASNYIVEIAGDESGPYTFLDNVPSNFYQHSFLLPGTTNYYRVKAYAWSESNDGNGDFTMPVSGSTAPAAPTGLAAVPGNGQVSVSWNPVPGAAGYGLYIDNFTGGGTGSSRVLTVYGTAYLDTPLTNGSTYIYTVRAFNWENAYGDPSPQVAVTPFDDSQPPPAAPSTLTGSGLESRVVLMWPSVVSATSYKVYRGLNPGGPYTFAAVSTTTTAMDRFLINGTSYYYVVRAVNAYGESADSPETAVVPAPVSRNICLTNFVPNAIDTFDVAVTGPAGFVGRLGGAGISMAMGVTIDAARDVIVVTRLEANRVEVYARGATGTTAPIRVIAGPATQLGGPTGVAYDPVDDVLFVASMGNGQVNVYDAAASGNAAPLRSFAVTEPFGLALDMVNREVWVTGKYTPPAGWGEDRLYAFAMSASGSTLPLREIQPSAAGISLGIGLAYSHADERVYAVSEDSPGSVVAWDRMANGATAPVWQLEGMMTGLDPGDPSALAIDDSNGELYVAKFGPANGVLVFSTAVSGDVSPVRSNGGGWNSRLGYPVAMALGGSGEVFVVNLAVNELSVYDTAASGDEAPLRILGGHESGLLLPRSVAADTAGGELFVLNMDSSLTVYPLGATGDTPPARRLSGMATGIQDPRDVAYDASDGEIAVLSVGDRVQVFPASASGDTAPARQIQGPATGLNFALAMDVHPLTGEIIVSDYAGNAIRIFAAGASGNVSPIRVIDGPLSNIDGPLGVAYSALTDEIVVLTQTGRMLFYQYNSTTNKPWRWFDTPLGFMGGGGPAITHLTIDEVNEVILASTTEFGLQVYGLYELNDTYVMPRRTIGNQANFGEATDVAVCE